MNTNDKIKILLVEDSAVQRQLVTDIIDSDPMLQVIGVATNGVEAINALKTLNPNIVVMDLHMPKMNGVETIRHIMSHQPIPIVAMSASDSMDDVVNGFHALEAGALAFAEKPKNIYSARFEAQCEHLLQMIRLMSEVKVIKRYDRQLIGKPTSHNDHSSEDLNILANKSIKLIAIGVSTGGPLVLQTILSAIPKDFPPILIVQHITSGFVDGLVQWLATSTHCLVELAQHNTEPLRGHVYLAPDKHHMGVADNGRIVLQVGNDERLCPSVSHLFKSVAESYKDHAMGIMLTGMGTDGAEELLQMKNSGAVTIAQNKETSLIFGMPAQAIKLGAAKYVMSPQRIAEAISHLTYYKGDL